LAVRERAEEDEMSDLKALSNRAYPGPWSIHGDTNEGWIGGPETEDGGDVIADMPLGAEDSIRNWPHNAAFICALVNAYREGRLIECRAALALTTPQD
jgi:hypothetical protein